MKLTLLCLLPMCIAFCCIAGCRVVADSPFQGNLASRRQEVVDQVKATTTELENTRIEIIWQSENNASNCFVAVHTRHRVSTGHGWYVWWDVDFVETSRYGLQKLYEWAAKRG